MVKIKGEEEREEETVGRRDRTPNIPPPKYSAMLPLMIVSRNTIDTPSLM